MKKVIIIVLCCISFLLQTSCGNHTVDSETHDSYLNNIDDSDSSETTENTESFSEPDTSGVTLPSAIESETVDIIENEKVNSILSYSTWYHYYVDGENYKLYTLDFNISSGKMQWNIGWFESEWENTFVGSFTVDHDGVFNADIYDERRDVTAQISFTIEVVNTTTGEEEILFTVTDVTLDKYSGIVNQQISFSLDNTPIYPQVLECYSVELQKNSGNIVVDFNAEPQLTVKGQIVYDGSGEEIFRFSILENTTIDEYFSSMPKDNIQYIEDTDLSNTTVKKYPYNVYYRDKEIRKGQYVRQYMIFIVIDETSIVLIDAYHYTYRNMKNELTYYEENILVSIQSLDVKETVGDVEWREHTFNYSKNDVSGYLLMIIPSTWEENEGGNTFSEKLTYSSGFTASKKRLEICRRTGLTEEIWTSDFDDSSYYKYGPFTGVTEKGYKYTYFYREPQIEKDVNWRIYYFYVSSGEGIVYTISIHHNLDVDSDNYLEMVIIPSIESVTIE